jgi:hypothetical protein
VRYRVITRQAENIFYISLKLGEIQVAVGVDEHAAIIADREVVAWS